MRFRPTPSTVLCLASGAAAFLLPFTVMGLPASASAILGVSLLALPFLILSTATLFAAGRLANSLLVLLSLLAFIPWLVSVGATAWFQLGLVGAAFLGTLMGLAAAFLAWLVHRFAQRRPDTEAQSGT